MTFIKEACAEGLRQAIRAQELGADRIELCDELSIGGITPSKKTIESVVKNTKIPIRVIIRPRGGNFIYSDNELVLMSTQIELCKKLSVEGVVFGVLKQDNRLNIQVIKDLINLALPLEIIIHKAIDETPNIYQSLKELESLGQNITILTSGGKPTAEEGKHVLKKLVNIANEKTEILPAGKINTKNLQSLHQYISAKAYHGKRIVGELS